MENSKCVTRYVANVNAIVSKTLSGREFIPLGTAYSTMALQSVQENLILHRANKLWEAPSDHNSEKRRIDSIRAVFEYDSKGLTEFCPATLTLDPFTRQQLYNTRLAIHSALKKYVFDPSKLRMPSGETVRSARGDVSIVAKLRDRNQWCITADCFDMAATVIYRTPGLKRAARKHIGNITHEERSRLYSAYCGNRDVGFCIFKELLLTFVTIVDGSRIETVPKSTTEDRVISCEPMLNMIVQSVIEEGLRDVIREVFGIDLNTAQAVHQELINDLLNATVDLKNASNSNWTTVIEFLYPGWFVKQLKNSRSPMAQSSDVGSHQWNMIAPMGNGFTFGLMTFTLLCAARQYDSFAHVFGDDIIIDKDAAPAFLDLIRVLGYQLNDSKTFLDGEFRESCGGFIHGSTYLKSYHLEWASDVVGANVIVNKVMILADYLPVRWLQRLKEELLSVVPALCKRWTPELEVTGAYVCYTTHSQFVKLRNDDHYNSVRKEFLSSKRSKRFVKQSQLSLHNLAVGYECSIKSNEYQRVPLDNANPFWAGYYYWSGRCLAPTRRNNDSVSTQLICYEVARASSQRCNNAFYRTAFPSYVHRLFKDLRRNMESGCEDLWLGSH